MKLKLYMLNVVGGPTILQKFEPPKYEVEEYCFSKNFALFSSREDLSYWQDFFEKNNGDYSYVLIEITDLVQQHKCVAFLDKDLKQGEGMLNLISKFAPKQEEVVVLTTAELEFKLEVILDKISEGGSKSLTDEDRYFLETYKK